MRNAFSLFELLIVIVIISFLSIFIIQKSENTIEFANKTKIKSEIALIRSEISKNKTSNILLNQDLTQYLDDEDIEKENSKLFNKILDFPLLSTTSLKKEIGKWIKSSKNTYKVFLSHKQSIEYKFEDNSFICKSELSICKEFE